MYLKQKKKNPKQKKIILIIAAIVIFIMLVIFVIIQIVNSTKKPSGQTSPTNQTSSQSTPTAQQASTSDKGDNLKKVTQNEGVDPNSSSELTGSISSAFIANGQFDLRVHIDQSVSGGTCTLTMTQGAKTFSQTANIMADVSSSTCQGFSAPEGEVSAGTWHVVIDLKGSNGKNGKIESEVNL